jgi:hypothetical protein
MRGRTESVKPVAALVVASNCRRQEISSPWSSAISAATWRHVMSLLGDLRAAPYATLVSRSTTRSRSRRRSTSDRYGQSAAAPPIQGASTVEVPSRADMGCVLPDGAGAASVDVRSCITGSTARHAETSRNNTLRNRRAYPFKDAVIRKRRSTGRRDVPIGDIRKSREALDRGWKIPRIECSDTTPISDKVKSWAMHAKQ